MKSSPSFFLTKTLHPSGSHAGFTLVELMTVIAIILVLMGMIFPAVESVKNSGRRAQAKNDIMQVTNAVKHYYTEYGKYPSTSAAAAGAATADTGLDTLLGDRSGGLPAVGENSILFNTLRAIDRTPNDNHALNPRRIVYFEGRSVADAQNPKNGFSDRSGGQGSQGSFYDPWGNQYYIIMDTNYDSVLDTGAAYSDFSSEDTKPRTGVGAFSLGKDGVVGDAKSGRGRYRNGQNNSDDVISWQ